MNKPQPTTERRRNYWIFQKPAAYFTDEHEPRPGVEIELSVPHLYQDMQPGDVVYLGTGQQGDLVNVWGLLTSSATEGPAVYRISMTCKQVVEPPVTYEELYKRAPQTKWLAEEEGGLDLIAGVDDGEAVVLNELIRSRPGVKAPPDPSEELTEETGEGSGAAADREEVMTLGQALERYKLSDLSRGVLLRAGQLARERRRHRNNITTSCVLFAAIRLGRHQGEPDNAAQFLDWWFNRFFPETYPREFEKFRDETVGGGSKSAPAGATAGDDATRLSSSTRHVVENAQRIADYVRKGPAGSRPRTINARDLVGALLYEMSSPGRERGAARRLNNMGASLERLRTAYVKDFLVHPKNLEDDPARWTELLIELKPVPELRRRKVVRAVEPALPRIDSDTPSAKDHLNITPEVQGFARIIATRKVSTPLSIGLFGDWGSGKSTFMEQLQAEVEKIACEVRLARAERKETDYYGNIVQIKFNAWHYAEANLWASLVSHVFENLSFNRGPAEKKLAAERKNLLLTQLDTSLAAQKVAEGDVKEKEQEYESAKTALDTAKREQAEARVHLFDLAAHGVWPLVRKAIDDDDETRRRVEAARDVLDKHGLSEEDLKREIDATRTVAGRAQVHLSLVTKDPRRGLWLALILALTILIPLGLWYLVNRLGLNEALDDIAAGVSPLLTFAGTAYLWFRSKRAAAAGVLDTLDKAGERLDAVLRATRSRYDEDVARLKAEVSKKETEVEKATTKVSEAREKVEKTVAELREMEPGRMLERFVQERAASTDYRKLLGVVALIRSDFKRLSDLLLEQDNSELRAAVREIIKRHRKATDQPADAQTAAAKTDAPGGDASAAATPEEAGAPADEEAGAKAVEPFDEEVEKELEKYRIERIVLYIDDLDRCPPKQVVDVLQAIHLLLAFKLFVVVVGVDARWVRHALRKQYPDLLGEDHDVDGDKTAAGDHHLMRTATPRDYVEKIFQVPFWLKPMSTTASEKLLKNLIPDSDITPPSEPNGGGDGGNGGGGDRNDTGGQTANGAGGPGDNDNGRAANTQAGGQAGRDQSATQSDTTRDTAGGGGGAGNGGDSGSANDPANSSTGAGAGRRNGGIPLQPKSLMLESKERDAMVKLSKIIGKTPRTMKRFVNVYRIIKAGLDGERLDALVGAGKDDGEYRAVLMLLAVAHGAPEVAPLFFRGVKAACEPNGEKKVGDGKNGEGKSDPGLKAFLAAMPRPRSESTDPAPEDWSEVIAELKKFAGLNEQDIPLSVLMDWAPVVVRYTFQLGRLSEEIDPPEEAAPEQAV